MKQSWANSEIQHKDETFCLWTEPHYANRTRNITKESKTATPKKKKNQRINNYNSV